MMFPVQTTLDIWRSSLVTDFPDDNIPGLSGDDWRHFGDSLAQEQSFEESGAPGTSGFNDWQSWAVAVFQTMANY